jgi:hypothetical protein
VHEFLHFVNCFPSPFLKQHDCSVLASRNLMPLDRPLLFRPCARSSHVLMKVSDRVCNVVPCAGDKGMLSRSVTGEGLRRDVSVLGRDLAWNVPRAVHSSVNPTNTPWEMCHVMTVRHSSARSDFLGKDRILYADIFTLLVSSTLTQTKLISFSGSRAEISPWSHYVLWSHNLSVKSVTC